MGWPRPSAAKRGLQGRTENGLKTRPPEGHIGMVKERTSYYVALFGTNEPDEKERVLRSIRRNRKSRDTGYVRPIAHNDKIRLSALSNVQLRRLFYNGYVCVSELYARNHVRTFEQMMPT
jgi:hypothetical protein